MSQIGLGMGEPEGDEPDYIEPEEPRPRRRPRRRRRGCLPVLLVLVVVVGGLAVGGKIAYDEISARLAPAAD